MLLNTEEAGSEVIMLGAELLQPQKRDWKGNFPFLIRGTFLAFSKIIGLCEVTILVPSSCC